jgi:hypothetical protein
MDAKTLQAAIGEAQRFLRVANLLRETIEERKRGPGEPTWLYMENGTALCGSVRRASLDLTRALAEMRKS